MHMHLHVDAVYLADCIIIVLACLNVKKKKKKRIDVKQKSGRPMAILFVTLDESFVFFAVIEPCGKKCKKRKTIKEL